MSKITKEYKPIQVNYDCIDNLIYNDKRIVFDKRDGVTCKLTAEEHLAFVALSIYAKIGLDIQVVSAIDLFRRLTNSPYIKNKDRRIVNSILEGLQGLNEKEVIVLENPNSKMQINTDFKVDISKIRTSIHDSKPFYALHHQEISRIMLVNKMNDLSIDRAKLLLLFSIIVDALSYHDKGNSNMNDELAMSITADMKDDFKGIYCWYSQEQLASMLKTTPKTIRDYLKILEELKLIYVYRFDPYFDQNRQQIRSATNWIGRYQHKAIIERLSEIRKKQLEYSKKCNVK